MYEAMALDRRPDRTHLALLLGRSAGPSRLEQEGRPTSKTRSKSCAASWPTCAANGNESFDPSGRSFRERLLGGLLPPFRPVLAEELGSRITAHHWGAATTTKH